MKERYPFKTITYLRRVTDKWSIKTFSNTLWGNLITKSAKYMLLVIKMAQPANHVSLILLAVAASLYVCLSASSAAQNNYPPGSLACKTFEMTKMDCSNRNLLAVPFLDENFTTTLDLSRNQVKNITGAPFEKLPVLLVLDLSYNQISWMSSTAFRGLQSLVSLELQVNLLFDLPDDVFANLPKLVYLDMNRNRFPAIPSQALSQLRALQELSFMTTYCCSSEIQIEGFQNLTNLNTLSLFIWAHQLYINSNVFLPLSKLPIKTFVFGWAWVGKHQSISKEVFAPLTNMTYLQTSIVALPAMVSVYSSLQFLYIIAEPKCPVLVLNNTSLQVLQKLNASLTELIMTLVLLQRVEDHTFTWTPNLFTLGLNHNQISYIAKNAFYELNSLQTLSLYNNSLTYVPSDALEVFRKSASLQCLDLGKNRITELVKKDTFSAISNSVTYLNLDISNKLSEIHINWIGNLQHLKNLTFTINTIGSSSYIIIESERPSLQTLDIRNIGTSVEFTKPLCTLFPILEVFIAPNSKVKPDLILLDLEACSYLKELDLSGTLAKFGLAADWTQSNITLSNLHTLKLRQNKLPSMKQLFFINAPKLKSLDLAENLLTTVDSEIDDKYPGLTILNVQGNQLQSLSGLETWFSCRISTLLQIKSLQYQIGFSPSQEIWKHLISATIRLNARAELYHLEIGFFQTSKLGYSLVYMNVLLQKTWKEWVLQQLSWTAHQKLLSTLALQFHLLSCFLYWSSSFSVTDGTSNTSYSCSIEIIILSLTLMKILKCSSCCTMPMWHIMKPQQ